MMASDSVQWPKGREEDQLHGKGVSISGKDREKGRDPEVVNGLRLL